MGKEVWGGRGEARRYVCEGSWLVAFVKGRGGGWEEDLFHDFLGGGGKRKNAAVSVREFCSWPR